jgi:hypothetical protein
MGVNNLSLFVVKVPVLCSRDAHPPEKPFTGARLIGNAYSLYNHFYD